jgi:hypothetical protein
MSWTTLTIHVGNVRTVQRLCFFCNLNIVSPPCYIRTNLSWKKPQDIFYLVAN